MTIPQNQNPKRSSIFSLLRPYGWLIALLLLLTIAGNGLNLWVPRIIAETIDSYILSGFSLFTTSMLFLGVSVAIFVLLYLQSILQVYLAEKVAKDLRSKLIQKIALEDYDYIQKVTSEKLLTYLTSDVDAIKNFVSQAISSIISSIFLIAGATFLLISINWKLALAVLAVLPVIGIFFAVVLSRVRKLFKANQETIDWLNRIINESIFGASLIRILNSQTYEYAKFLEASTKSRDIGLNILKLFATLMPSIALLANIAVLTILVLGGHYVILGTLTLGDFTAFNGYLALLIFPIIIIGFMSGIIAQATASYSRIQEVLLLQKKKETPKTPHHVEGRIDLMDVSLSLSGKNILKHISFSVSPHSRTAIIGPTGAGKTQLLYLLMGLIPPTSGLIHYDGVPIDSLEKKTFHSEVGLVFQDSNLFNLSLRENIAFSPTVDTSALQKAIDTAELHDFIEMLPDGLDTIVSERGTSLSGGQKQRIMLARVLALDPKILFLDDFTARLDTNTEQKILDNVRSHYPDITLISVTQKIESIKDYDQIVLLMEGEMLALGTHDELLLSSPEYNQIYNSQFSTNTYELSTH